MKQKIISITICFLLTLTCFSFILPNISANAAETANNKMNNYEYFIHLVVGNEYINVNGKLSEIDLGRHTVPILRDSRILVPLRKIVESIGGNLTWFEKEKKVSIYARNKRINIWIGNKEIDVDGKKVLIDTEPVLENSRTYLPLRAVAENLGFIVYWNNTDKSASLCYLNNTNDINTLNELSAIIQNEKNPKKAIDFIENKIRYLSPSGASIMVLMLESMQNNSLNFYKDMLTSNYVQKMLSQTLNIHSQINQKLLMENQILIEDSQIMSILNNILSSGYKIIYPEGLLELTIDYEFYENYKEFVSDDIKKYIEIMSIESSQQAIEDNSLKISWEELINRILTQEKFLNRYKNSISAPNIASICAKYIKISLFGLNNSPLFSYEDNTINEEAKQAMLAVANSNYISPYSTTIKDFLNLCKKSNYKLNNEINTYRSKYNEDFYIRNIFR